MTGPTTIDLLPSFCILQLTFRVLSQLSCVNNLISATNWNELLEAIAEYVFYDELNNVCLCIPRERLKSPAFPSYERHSIKKKNTYMCNEDVKLMISGRNVIT